MKNPNDILKFIKNKQIYELRRKFTTFQSIFTGLIVASILIFAELIKVIFDYAVSKSSRNTPDLLGANVASQLLVFSLVGMLTIIVGIFYSKNISFYISLKERKIDKINRKVALQRIEKELEELEDF